MTTTARLLPGLPSEYLRPFDVGRDLNPVADLIEHCFTDTLDTEGERYLRQMREAARNPRFLRWAASVSDHISLPLNGFVWEEDGRLVGNLSLIPFTARGRRVYLIANVAVHPDYRRRGIARALTATALEYAVRRRAIDAIWLQVRAENAPALRLYQSVGFRERARRTTWHMRRDYWPLESIPRVKIRPVGGGQWGLQRAWLNRLYPSELRWNMRFNLSALRPDFWGFLYRLVTGLYIRQWAALRDGQLLGVLARQPSAYATDHLWLAAPPGGEDLAIRALLSHLRKGLTSRRFLSLDFPAELGAKALESVGFHPYQTLIWMEFKIRN